MNRLGNDADEGFATSAIVVSPLVLIVVILLTVAAGYDFFHFVGEAPVALALCGPAAFLLLRRLMPSLLPPGRAGDLDHAPKSIS